MIGIESAQKSIRAWITATDSVELPLAEAFGGVLAEDVASEIDSPPHDKSLVDGYAILSKDIAAGRDEFTVLEEVSAGEVPRRVVTEGMATRIMTGAPIPPGADAVVMVEQTRPTEAGARVVIGTRQVTSGQSIMRQGRSIKRGQVVLQAGCRLRSIEVGLLAEVGHATTRVHRRPHVAHIQTGDELVAADQPLKPGQIRNSNGPMLDAMVRRAGATPIDLGIVRDEEFALAERIGKGLESDFLILSGGVSAGVKDLVPAVLANAGVSEIFHKVEIRPGKPIWFGVAEASSHRTLVFGLPGNPVSSLVCFRVLVAPAIAWRAGLATDSLTYSAARLTSRHSIRGSRPTYWPAEKRLDPGGLENQVGLLEWQGSADLCTLAAANCLAFFPEGDRDYEEGEVVRVLSLESPW